jgi:putative FmdB family regulatory protein
MPTYDYRCQKCGHQFEVFQSITADPLRKCPVCSGVLERLIGGGGGLVFKGSGFYITDYKNKKNGNAPKEAKPKNEEKSAAEPKPKAKKE